MLLFKLFVFVAWSIMAVGFIFFGWEPDKFIVGIMFVAFIIYLFNDLLDEMNKFVHRKIHKDKHFKVLNFKNYEEFEEWRKEKEEFGEHKPHGRGE